MSWKLIVSSGGAVRPGRTHTTQGRFRRGSTPARKAILTRRRKVLRCTAPPVLRGEVTKSSGPPASTLGQARMSSDDVGPSKGRGGGVGTAWSLCRTVRKRPL